MAESSSRSDRSKSGQNVDAQGDLRVAFQVDSICDAFESSWKAGSRPDLDRFLQGTDLPLETLFVELVLIDISYRMKAGEKPGMEEYAQRFPHLREALIGITLPAAPGENIDATVSVSPPSHDWLGKFELTEELGKGAFGVVWKARDTQLQRWVALKQYRQEYSGVSRKLLAREALAVAQIDHPNVVRVYEIGQHDKHDYVAFEYVSGGSLAQWMRKQPAHEGIIRIPPEQAARMVLQLADGLKAVHACNVIHRDFKPGNLLLDEQGTLKIADFGLARHANLLATIGGDGILLGTIPYMSPEQCRGKDVTARSDLYSLGVVLYEMLTGRRPFLGSRTELLAKIVEEVPPTPGELAKIPKSLENICLRAMEKNPDDRYQTAAEMHADLQRFLMGEDVPRHRPSILTRARRTMRTHWVTTLSLMLGMVGLGALASTTLTQPEDGKRIVQLTSEPPGAKVAFIPLNPRTGIPQPEDIIHASGTTPISERLLPGDYLVEVYLEDGSGEFQEVYRQVPSDEQKLNTYDAYHCWRRDKENPNLIYLPKVKILPNSVLEDMVLVPGSDHFLVGEAGSSLIPAHERVVPSFYMDPTEVTLGEFQEMFDRERDPDSRWVRPPTTEHAMTVKWAKAVWMAEKFGKRLPDEFEFELAATRNGTQRYSWGDSLSDEAAHETSFGPVGTPRFDHVDYDAPIYGLGSNVAEWTMSWTNALYPRTQKLWQENVISPAQLDFRIYRGGDRETVTGNAEVSATRRDPLQRMSIISVDIEPGLGFRCVRSPGPRLKPEDFGRDLKLLTTH